MYVCMYMYGLARNTQKAHDIIEAWVRDEWLELWGRRPRVLLKTELEEVYFALYVHGAPPGTEPRDLEALFEKYGRLHATKICGIKNSDNAYFVNFAYYDGALAALEAGRGETLRFKAATLYAHAARNTTFLTQLTTQMRDSGRTSFSLDDAKRVGNQMTRWPPKENSIENLLKAAPKHFVRDRKTKHWQIHLIGQNALLAPSPEEIPPVSHPRSPSPALLPGQGERAMAERECVVCMDEVKTHAFVPCGHFCVCDRCAAEIMASSKKECPNCRGAATQTMKIYG